MLLETAPIMFFGGKGGVGKTTLATATALELSQTHNVLLVSTDPAHNLDHIFDAALSDAPTHLTENLSAIELDPARATEEHLATVGASMRRFMPEHLHGEVKKHRIWPANPRHAGGGTLRAHGHPGRKRERV